MMFTQTDDTSTVNVRLTTLLPIERRFKSIMLRIDYFGLKTTWRHIRLRIIDSYVYGWALTSCVMHEGAHPPERRVVGAAQDDR